MATFEEQRLFEECSELRARLTTANKENEKLRLAAEAHTATLRKALVLSREQHEVCGHDDRCDYCREARESADAALALKPGDALRALAVRLCEAQREADRSAFLSLLKQARSEVSGLKGYRPSLGVDVCENMTLRREHQAPLVVDDVLGKAGK